MLQNYHSLEHFLSLLKFCFPVIVVSLAQINSQKFSTGSDVSYVDTLHGKVSFQPNFTKTLGYVFKEFPNSAYALQSTDYAVNHVLPSVTRIMVFIL